MLTSLRTNRNGGVRPARHDDEDQSRSLDVLTLMAMRYVVQTEVNEGWERVNRGNGGKEVSDQCLSTESGARQLPHPSKR